LKSTVVMVLLFRLGFSGSPAGGIRRFFLNELFRYFIRDIKM
jgi:hypothetical protein